MIEPSLEDLLQAIEQELLASRERFCDGVVSKRLESSIHYALGSRGKRLRPLMVIAAALSCRGTQSSLQAQKCALMGACAVEYVHTYSLIHDDLPCMDDDDYRRGRLSVHRQFDEGLAVLAGDALLADAFFLAAQTRGNAVAIVRELARCAGARGLVAGQAEDLATTNETSKTRWLAINEAKTARLFEACAVIGGLSVDASTVEIDALRGFGHHFGMAFQIKDDGDDVNGVASSDSAIDVKSMLTTHLDAANLCLGRLNYSETLHALIHFTFATAF